MQDVGTPSRTRAEAEAMTFEVYTVQEIDAQNAAGLIQDERIRLLENAISALSELNDALTYRLSELEEELARTEGR
jgi:hypothetical protein